MSKAVFMGRAGTITAPQKYGVIDPSSLEVFSGVWEALNTMGQRGLFLAVVGSEKAALPNIDYPALLVTTEQYIANMVAYPILFKLCVHHIAAKCGCRLPQPGLITAFQEMLNLDLASSAMIASKETEAEGARQAELPVIVRVSTGRGEWSKASEELPIYDTLLEASQHVLEQLT